MKLYAHSIWQEEHKGLWYEPAHWQDMRYFDTYEDALEYKEKFKGNMCYDYIVIRLVEINKNK